MRGNRHLRALLLAVILLSAPSAVWASPTDADAGERGSLFAPSIVWAEGDRVAPWFSVGRDSRLDVLDRERIERLEWTWLAAGITAFLGTAAILTAVDARAMEKDLALSLEESRRMPRPGSEIVDLAERTRRRAAMANVFWGATGAGALATGGLFYLEAWREAEGGTGLALGWRLP